MAVDVHACMHVHACFERDFLVMYGTMYCTIEREVCFELRTLMLLSACMYMTKVDNMEHVQPASIHDERPHLCCTIAA